MKPIIETLKTEAKVASQVLKGRAAIETLVPRFRNHVTAEVYRCTCGKGNLHTGTMCPRAVLDTVHEGWNSRTANGALWQATAMGSAVSTPALYISLAASVSVTTQNTDTYIGGTTSALEITANGCGRTAGNYGSYVAPSSLGGAASYTISKTFSCTTAAQAVGFVGLNYGSSATVQPTLFVEATLTTVASLAVNDSLAITYVVNI